MCSNGSTAADAITRYSVGCTGGACTADFNRNGTIPDAAIASMDINYDGDQTDVAPADSSGTPALDAPSGNDWLVMYETGKYAIDLTNPNAMSRKLFRVYQSLFEGNAADVSAWAITPTVTNVGTQLATADGDSYGSALAFGGPANPGSVLLPSSSVLNTLGTTVGGFGPNGFRFDIHIRIDPAAGAGTHEILNSALFRVYTTSVGGGQHQVNFRIDTGASNLIITNATTLITPGTWYWVTATYRKLANAPVGFFQQNFMKLYVTADTANSWGVLFATDGTCVVSGGAINSTLSPGAITFGLNPSIGSSTAWHGDLDEPRLMNHSLCLYAAPGDPQSTFACGGITTCGPTAQVNAGVTDCSVFACSCPP